MIANPLTDRLFIGGTADGRLLPVRESLTEYRLPSLAKMITGTHPPDHGDPRPEKLPVVEIYRPLTVKHGHVVETVFALNALGNEAIQVQLVKHFGNGVSFTP